TGESLDSAAGPEAAQPLRARTDPQSATLVFVEGQDRGARIRIHFRQVDAMKDAFAISVFKPVEAVIGSAPEPAFVVFEEHIDDLSSLIALRPVGDEHAVTAG